MIKCKRRFMHGIRQRRSPLKQKEEEKKTIIGGIEYTVTESEAAKKQREEEEDKQSDRPVDWATDSTEIKIPKKPMKGGDKSVVPDWKKEN